MWDTGSGTVTVSGSTLTLNSATINSNLTTGIEMDPGAGPVTVSSLVTLGAPQTWLNNSSNLLTVSGKVVEGTNLLTIAGSGSDSLSGVIAGSGGLTMSGPGLLTLGGANTFIGNVTVNGGTLAAGTTQTALGTLAAGRTITIQSRRYPCTERQQYNRWRVPGGHDPGHCHQRGGTLLAARCIMSSGNNATSNGLTLQNGGTLIVSNSTDGSPYIMVGSLATP